MIRRIKLFFTKLNRLVDWIPLIWRTGDYDYGYSIEIFKYQLERTANYIEHRGHLENSKLVVSQIRTAIDLIDKSYLGGYVEQAEEEFERQYGKCEMLFNEYDEDNFEIKLWWASAEDSEHNDQINDFHTAHMFAAYAKADRAKALLWKYINKNIESWWD